MKTAQQASPQKRPMQIMACVLATAALLLLASSRPVQAQSWLPLDGEIILSFSFHGTNYEGHILSDGEREEFLPSYSRVALVNIDYGITNRLAFTARIPYVFTRNGPDPSPIYGNTGLDDGFWHGNLQDYTLKLRYAAAVFPMAVTPFVLYSIPSHNYETQYEAAPGRGLQELIVGADFGGLLRPLTSRGFYEARLSYAFVEETAGVSTDRLNGGLALGYFVTPTVSAIVNGNFQNVYGGLTIDYIFGPDATPEEFLLHDGLLEDDHWRAGLGAAWAFRPRWSTSAFWSTIIDGTDAHYGDSYTITVSRRF